MLCEYNSEENNNFRKTRKCLWMINRFATTNWTTKRMLGIKECANERVSERTSQSSIDKWWSSKTIQIGWCWLCCCLHGSLSLSCCVYYGTRTHTFGTISSTPMLCIVNANDNIEYWAIPKTNWTTPVKCVNSRGIAWENGTMHTLCELTYLPIATRLGVLNRNGDDVNMKWNDAHD